MAERAHVTSVEAIETFRARLILYMSKARAAVEEVSDEIQHTRAWLENDQRTRWERECRRCQRVLDEAEQELFNTKISRIRTQTAAQLLAVERAKHALRQAEAKRDAVKRWAREFGNRAEPLGKQIDQLLGFLATDMGKGVAYLGSVIKALEAYTATRPGLDGSAPASLREQAIDSAQPAPDPIATTPLNPAESAPK
jgi:hypothetical protein